MGEATTTNSDVAASSDLAKPSQTSSATSSASEIAFVDSGVEVVDELTELVRRGVDVVLIDSSTDPIEQMDKVLRSRSDVSALHIVSHGESGRLHLGGQVIDSDSLRSQAGRLQSWRSALTSDADILLYGCDAAAGERGQSFLKTWSRLTGADVGGSIDRTGSPLHRGDWELEAAVGQVDTELFAAATALEKVDTALAITIRAAGSTGLEQMELRIDGVTVQTWDNIGGDAEAEQYLSFTYNGAPGVTADQVRVAFTNDVWDPVQGIDYNLRVDNIEIDGEIFETEDPSVFSTGTWQTGVGFQPGFLQSEWLNGNGYFQYADSSSNTGSEITIYAAGSENTETMELWIGGTNVAVWNNVGGDAASAQYIAYQYTAVSTVSADDIQVHFSNDEWDPVQGIDSNLRVDRIEIDNDIFETEDPSVFGTGTWLPADGIQPGFRSSEWIHTNGYFQYAEQSNAGSSISIYAAGDENTESIDLWIGGTRVKTWDNIAGNAASGQYVAYQYTAAATVAPEDVQIHFTNAQWDPGQGIDNNLRVDRIEIDSVSYETEAPNVYSTGTWLNGEITPGFKQSEWLHSDGFFEYGNARDAGVIALGTSVLTVDEDGGSVLVDVIRTVGSDGYITVDYDTETLNAQPGVDYTPVSGTFTFAEGETVKTIVIPILDDGLVESIEQFNVNIDNVNGGAVLLVPRTATVSIIDDEVALPDYPDFASAAGLVLNGDAAISADVLELTAQIDNQVGSAFYDTAITLDNDGSFRSSFSFEIDGGSGGADGFTFTIQNDPLGSNAIGNSAGLLGFDGISNAVGVEFDTFQNAPWDVSDNHVSIINGAVSNSLKTLIPAFDLNDGSQYYAWVEYNGGSDVLAVYLSDTPSKPALALLKATVDLEVVVGDTAYFGFTAATGPLNNSHKIHSWQMDQIVPPQDPPTEEGDTVVDIDVVTAGLSQPTAIEWLPDGTMLIAEKGGVVQTAIGGVVSATLFIDISDIVNGVRDRGLLDIAVHPDFENNPYVYLLFTYDPPEVFDQAGGTLAGPDGKGNRAGRLIRVTADVNDNYLTAEANSEVILLGTNSTWDNFNGFANSTFDFDEPPAGENPDGTYVQDFIASDSESHTVGALAFGTDGMLFVSIGDGASYNNIDVRADRVQDIDSLSGKVLRIDPLTGQGLTDNPFYDGDPGSIYDADPDSNRSKVYQLGLRNPFRISVDPVGGQLYIGDVGWGRWEEINAAGPGANFGWPFYEGGNGVSLVQPGYANTDEGAAFFAQSVQVEASIYALNHQADGINAIVMGDVYSGSLYGSEYTGDVFFNDLGQGIVRHASIDASGSVTDVKVFTTGANIVVSISQGPDGALYYVDLDDNLIGRWEVV